MSLRSIRIKKRIRQLAVVAGFLMIFALDFSALNYISQDRDQISTTQADALYGGVADSHSYPYAGYLIDYSGVFNRQVCGITFLSSNLGVSAAHCFLEDGVYYAGLGTIQTEPVYNLPVEKYELDNDWDEETLSGDIALVSIGNSSISAQQFAQIAVPQVGCNYEILAYGSTDQRVLSNEDLRRKSDICIESISDERFYLTSKTGGVCFGDSGSPIFIKDTNKIVGVVSAITADNDKYSKDNCFVNNRAVATRLDSSLSFISETREPLLATSNCPIDSNELCSDDEKCRSNKCRKPSDYAYISNLDYRSADFVFGDYLGTAFAVAAGFLTFLFLVVIYRSFQKTYG